MPNPSLYRQLTLPEILRWRAFYTPHFPAYSYFHDGINSIAQLTYRDLYCHAHAVAKHLQLRAPNAAPVLLLYSPGLDFIEAFLGCMIAGLRPIALPPLDNLTARRSTARLKAIWNIVGAHTLLSNVDDIFAIVTRELRMNSEAPLTMIAHKDIPRSSHSMSVFTELTASMDDVAFIQFTSGSTDSPRGIQITNKNIAHQLSAAANAGQFNTHSSIVNWMPHSHDYGLIFGNLLPLYLGIPCVTMPPSAFIRKPVRWLQLISRHNATHSCGPTFSYDYCCRHIAQEDIQSLDLSSWEHAGIGAEPIHPQTIRDFTRLFERYGFRAASFCPGYGLAESTLGVTSSPPGAPVTFLNLDIDALANNEALTVTNPERNTVSLVGCGSVVGSKSEIAIVDPELCTRCAPNRIGEIWISSESVARGYWSSPTESATVFGGLIRGENHGPFLRTGDLGFLRDGELFVTGRLKDLIIIAGHNYYPHEIERIVESSHSLLRAHGSVAIPVIEEGTESVVILVEVRAELAIIKGILNTIRQQVGHHLGLDVLRILAIPTGSLCKTASGKLQRRECKRALLENRFPIIMDDSYSGHGVYANAQDSIGRSTHYEPTLIANLAATLSLVTNCVCFTLGIDQSSLVDVDAAFSDLGIGSLHAIRLCAELQDRIKVPLSPAAIFEHSSIRRLSEHLCGRTHRPPWAKPNQKRTSNAEDPIAIIGMDCRFPHATSPNEFWTLLAAGLDAIDRVPKDRWNIDQFYAPGREFENQISTPYGGFISDIDCFDRSFFKISRQEANYMDPQQRILLEVALTALERSGQNVQDLAGSSTGVFIGISNSDYSGISTEPGSYISPFAGPGSAMSISANRISYVFDLRGPSISIDTACSSSLVAVHLACESLRNGESSMALAGGVNLLLSPHTSIALSQAGFLSPDGCCKTFDVGANGYVRSEGCGLVVLKRLSDAIADRDPVLAVIRGTAVNQDGRSHGLTAPNPQAQRDVLVKAFDRAGIMPFDVTYMEAHGTGTLLGDTVEVESMSKIISPIDGSGKLCYVGSAKVNIGHLEAAAGIAGLIKVVLMIQHCTIPPHRNLQKINPNIRLEGTRLRVPARATSWEHAEEKLAGVSAFGFGGTNAHVVVGGPTPDDSKIISLDRPLHLLAISARSDSELRSTVARYIDFLGSADPEEYPNVCFTAGIARSDFDHRLCIISPDAGSACDSLKEFLDGGSPSELIYGRSNDRPITAHLHFCGSLSKLRSDVEYRSRTAHSIYWKALGMLCPAEDFEEYCGVAAEYTLGVLLQRWLSPVQGVTGSGRGRLAEAHMSGKVDMSGFDLPSKMDTECRRVSTDTSPGIGKCDLVFDIRADMGWGELFRVLAYAFVAGGSLNWAYIDEDFVRQKTLIPTTSFRKERYWVKPRTDGNGR